MSLLRMKVSSACGVLAISVQLEEKLEDKYYLDANIKCNKWKLIVGIGSSYLVPSCFMSILNERLHPALR